jgi:hypothetical protein
MRATAIPGNFKRRIFIARTKSNSSENALRRAAAMRRTSFHLGLGASREEVNEGQSRHVGNPL